MEALRKNKFIFWNLTALIFIKVLFSYSSPQFASLINGITVFDKEEVIAQTNSFRTTLGLNGLKESSALDLAAAQKLDDMKQNQYFAHTSPAGISPWYWIEANRYKYSYAGENLAIGFFSAQDTVNAWMNSPAHRANLANYNYKEIGVAVAPAKIQNSNGFLVVQLFGTPRPPGVATLPTSPVKARTSPIVTQPTTPPTPSQIAQLKPAATQIEEPAPIQSPIELAEEIDRPLASNVVQSSPRLIEFGRILNESLILYALIAFMISVVLLVFRELKKELVVRSAISLALLVLAIAVPVFQVSHIALIL